jgi:hypothetical protein
MVVTSNFLYFKHFEQSYSIVVDQAGPISEDLETTNLLAPVEPAHIPLDTQTRNKFVIWAMASYLAVVVASVGAILYFNASQEIKLFVAGSLGIASVLTGVILK